MGIANNNITIIPTSGYSPSFSWQVGLTSKLVSNNNLQFRATIRPLHGEENYTRVPSPTILYEETGIFVNSSNNQGQWSFPLETNAAITGGPYRNYQVVIESHDSNGNTSAGNLVGTQSENGWNAFNQGYDILAVQNPRETGIELGNNIPTQYSVNSGNLFNGQPGTGLFQNSGNGYYSYNYLNAHGEISIRYTKGSFDSNLVGGYLYVWTGQFPKLETIIESGIYGTSVIKSRFDFDPTKGYIYHPTAGAAFRGSNYVYTSVSFYDNLDEIALQNGIDISTGLYLSDNAICYNDVSVGSLTIGGFNTIYAMQYTGNNPPTGILGTGATILAQQYYSGTTSVLYLPNPLLLTGYNNYSGHNSLVGGGAGGNAILLNNQSVSPNFALVQFTLTTAYAADDTLSIYVNSIPIRDSTGVFDGITFFDILQYASLSGATVKIGDTVQFSGRDNLFPDWSLPPWSGYMLFADGYQRSVTGGYGTSGPSDFIPHWRDNGSITVSR